MEDVLKKRPTVITKAANRSARFSKIALLESKDSANPGAENNAA